MSGSSALAPIRRRAFRSAFTLPERTAWPRIAWALVGAAGVLTWMVLRSDAAAALWSGCFLRETFHIGCATCGFTRALASLARGDLAASFALHPLALPVAIEAILAWALWGAGLWRGRPMLRARWVGNAAGATAVATIVVWIVRLVAGTIPV